MNHASTIVLLVLLTACAGGGSPSGVAVEPRGTLGPHLLDAYDSGDVPALGVYVFNSAGTRGSGVVGLRSAHADIQVELDDRWHLGSDTKAMTATLVARLETTQVIDFDATLAEAFPEVEVQPGYAEVTLAELLVHRGGTPTSGQALYLSVLGAGTPSEQRSALATTVLQSKPVLERGTYGYSNVGYVVVGAALERVSGKSWESLITEHLFEPLEMTSCGFGPPDVDGDLSAPWGHIGLEPVPPGPDADNPALLGPAGTVHCSLGDWGKFAIDQLRGARGESSLLPTSAYERMHTPTSGGGEAFGWGVAEGPAGAVLTHTGSNGNFTAIIVLVPSTDRGLLVVANRGEDEETVATLDSVTLTVAEALGDIWGDARRTWRLPCCSTPPGAVVRANRFAEDDRLTDG